MITYTVTNEEAEDILKVLGSLPTQSGAYPLWQKLAEQFKEQKENEACQETSN